MIENTALKDDALIKAVLNELRKEILISRYFERFLKDNVSDDAVINYYNAHNETYQDKKVHVAHILLRLDRTMDEVRRKVKLTTAQEAYSKIQAGMSFADAAQHYSEDKVSANKGGDLGWLKQGSIDKAFSQRAFSMKAGETSEPFETSFGFHLLTVIEPPKITHRSLESVKGEIRYQLRKQAKDAEMSRLLANVVIN